MKFGGGGAKRTCACTKFACTCVKFACTCVKFACASVCVSQNVMFTPKLQTKNFFTFMHF